jgi:hypothetical protein
MKIAWPSARFMQLNTAWSTLSGVMDVVFNDLDAICRLGYCGPGCANTRELIIEVRDVNQGKAFTTQ